MRRSPMTQFLDMIRAVLSVIEVDEAWYLEATRTSPRRSRTARSPSAREHFLHNGYFEGRRPFAINVDERWYLTENPGVAEYIRSGRLEVRRSSISTMTATGKGRLPFPL